jgi:hypothetical protein
VADSCEHGKQPLYFINSGEFIDRLSASQELCAMEIVACYIISILLFLLCCFSFFAPFSHITFSSKLHGYCIFLFCGELKKLHLAHSLLTSESCPGGFKQRGGLVSVLISQGVRVGLGTSGMVND